MSDKNPLDPVRASHEEEFFHKKNQDLIVRLRHQLSTAETARALETATGIHDAELMSWLAELGITPENAAVLHLVPLFQVAWSDGAIQPAERELLEKAAAETGITPGTAAHGAFLELLKAPPSRGYYDAALIYTRLVLSALPEADASAARENLQSLAGQMARAAGGLFGIFSKVAEEERAALRQISAQLEDHPAASDLLKKV
jgi:tellurite resistance protein